MSAFKKRKKPDLVFAVGCRGDPQVVGKAHALIVLGGEDQGPGLLPLLLVGVGVDGEAVQLTVALWGQETYTFTLNASPVFPLPLFRPGGPPGQ